VHSQRLINRFVVCPGRPITTLGPLAETGRVAHNLALGAHGEELAARHVQAAGMEIIARNWRCRYGELDLVIRDAGVTAFVEVKTRSGRNFGPPTEAVTFAKRQRIRRLALLWLSEQDGPWQRVRFDVVSVLLAKDAEPAIEHLKAVF